MLSNFQLDYGTYSQDITSASNEAVLMIPHFLSVVGSSFIFVILAHNASERRVMGAIFVSFDDLTSQQFPSVPLFARDILEP